MIQPLDYVRMRCGTCDEPFSPGDKAKDPQSYPMIGLPRGVVYDPKRHNPGAVCVDCLLAIRYERFLEEERVEVEKLAVSEEKAANGVLSEETIKKEVSAGRMSATEGLFEFMALLKTRDIQATGEKG